MLLQRLKAYADERMTLPPTLYSEKSVRYIIELDGEGRLLNPRPTDTADPGNPKTKRGAPRLVPDIQRSVDIKPLLLADKADYTLGVGATEAKTHRVAACHAAYVDLLERCGHDTGAAEIEAVLHFLRSTPVDQLDLTDDFDHSALITFRVDDGVVSDLPSVQAFWAREHTPTEEAAIVMQCMVCGQQRPVLTRMQGKIKGVPGGQAGGTSLISANADAFESYGLEASLIAPTCADCGERLTKALNYLIADPRSHIVLGNTIFVYWTRKDVVFDLVALLDRPDPTRVRLLLEAVRSGKQTVHVDETAFFATALSGNGGRAVVRNWIDTTMGQVQNHVCQWFHWQRIVDAAGAAARPLSLLQLATATVREAKDILPTAPGIFLRAALNGTPLPWSVLYQAVRRNRAEQHVTTQRATLIKLVFASHQSVHLEDRMTHLDQHNTDAAYVCGRLLAVLAAIQRLAIPNIQAGIVEHFFGTASSAPASVFGRLLRGAQPHLSTIARDNKGAYVRLQQSVEAVTTQLTSFPRTLTLEQQGLFALGYYHQCAHNRAEAKAASERKQAGMNDAAVE